MGIFYCIKMDLVETGCGSVDRFQLPQGRMQWAAEGVSGEHGSKPSCSVKDGEFFDKLSDYEFRRETLFHGSLTSFSHKFIQIRVSCFRLLTAHKWYQSFVIRGKRVQM